MSNQTKAEVTWRLRRGMDRRFRSGHPWVYSNELTESPKGVEPGAIVQLQDAGGGFLARGFGNANSLISFRVLSRDPQNLDPISTERLVESLVKSHHLRMQAGFDGVSHRLCFGESDGLPGLVIDRYVLRAGHVFVIQAHTAGADRLLSRWEEILKSFLARIQDAPSWSQVAVVLRNDVGVRTREGIEEDDPRILKEIPGLSLQGVEIAIRSVEGQDPLWFRVDLEKGQKTGFFLDQFSNIQIAAQVFKTFQFSGASSGQVVRILDLCCYVGQWSAQLAAVFVRQGRKVEVVAVDASARALEFAKLNIEAQGADFKSHCGNVLKDLVSLPDQSFDLVISDPPALIKSRKDIAVGTRAYLQLATQVFRLVRRGGGVVSCSCSALLEEESFIQAQGQAIQRNSVQVQWIARGSQSPDHPVLAQFPEGRYLKAWMGAVTRS
jgi:23S rRNA (cytosine1962-C5)-methyltransferase